MAGLPESREDSKTKYKNRHKEKSMCPPDPSPDSSPSLHSLMLAAPNPYLRRPVPVFSEASRRDLRKNPPLGPFFPPPPIPISVGSSLSIPVSRLVVLALRCTGTLGDLHFPPSRPDRGGSPVPVFFLCDGAIAPGIDFTAVSRHK